MKKLISVLRLFGRKIFKNKKDDKKITSFCVEWGRAMCKACELAKVVANECYDRQYPISAAKLQKLLVVMHGQHLATYNKNLFSENVLCWKCGVAIKEVELKFILCDFLKKEKFDINIAILQTEDEIIHQVLDRYGACDVLEINQDKRLIELTNLYPFRPGEKTIIPNEAIRKVFLDYGEKV